MSPTLSLCMIVKDEEKYLNRCLASVAKAVREIIIVDTGSTDLLLAGCRQRLQSGTLPIRK